MIKKIIIALFFVCACILLTVGSINFFVRTFIVSKSVVDSRNADISGSIDLLWQKNITSRPVIIGNGIQNNQEPFLLMQEDSVILPVWNFKDIFSETTSLKSISLSDGEIKWQDMLRGDAFSLAVGVYGDHIFTVSSACPVGKTLCDEIEITKHEAETGEQPWQVHYAGILPVSALSIHDDTLNLSSGEHLVTNQTGNSFDVQTGAKLPTFNGMEHSASSFPTKYGAIPLALGYEPHEIVGNIAETDSHVFFLVKEESTLLAVNKESREISAKIKFDEEPFDLRGHGFALATTDDRLVVYLGDSDQLFAFHFDLATF